MGEGQEDAGDLAASTAATPTTQPAGGQEVPVPNAEPELVEESANISMDTSKSLVRAAAALDEVAEVMAKVQGKDGLDAKKARSAASSAAQLAARKSSG